MGDECGNEFKMQEVKHPQRVAPPCLFSELVTPVGTWENVVRVDSMFYPFLEINNNRNFFICGIFSAQNPL